MSDSIIYKYHLKPQTKTTFELPVGSVLVAVGAAISQQPCLWFKVPMVEGTLESRTFHVYGTGQPFDDEGLTHVGTFFDQGYVWHIFEEAAS